MYLIGILVERGTYWQCTGTIITCASNQPQMKSYDAYYVIHSVQLRSYVPLQLLLLVRFAESRCAVGWMRTTTLPPPVNCIRICQHRNKQLRCCCTLCVGEVFPLTSYSAAISPASMKSASPFSWPLGWPPSSE